MSLRHKRLTVLAGAALALVACQGVLDGSPGGGPDNGAYLTIRMVGSGPNLAGSETNVVAGDSVILRAEVMGAPDAYHTPVISASDSTALTLRPDGTARVRKPAPLNLTVTATARSPSTRPATLTAWSRLNLACTMEAKAGLSFRVIDSTTTQPVTSSAVIRVSDGAWRDSTASPLGTGLWGTAWERAGTYTASVEVAGYRPWSRAGIVVDKGLCHVIPVSITALLQRQ